MQMPSLFRNKYVRWVAMFLAVVNVLGYLSVKAYECLALFALTAYSANCYCKNTVCAILAGLFVANFVFGCSRVKEGLESSTGGAGATMQQAADKALEAAKQAMGEQQKCKSGEEWDEKTKQCEVAKEVATNVQDAADIMSAPKALEGSQ
jgi:hypothetical protein